jgi:putative ABC transport system permease protein
MFRLTLRSLWSHKARILLTALSVVVGVAFVSGAFVLTDSFEKSFDGLFKQLNQGVDFRVRGEVEFGDAGSGDPVPASLADELAAVPGVRAVEPGLQGTAVILKADGKPVTTAGAPTLGVSWSGEDSIGGTVLRQGSAPNGADQVAIDEATFKKLDIPLGDIVQIVGADGVKPYTLVGTVGLKSGGESFFGATIAAFDPVTAQTVLGSPGKYTAIDLAIDDGANPDTVQKEIDKVLPPGVEAVSGEQVAKETSDQIGQIVSIFRWVLLGFAMVALFVSAFLINNTFQIIISQRLRDLALLRAVGASGKQVRQMIVTESMIIAAVATVVGFAGGIVVSKMLTAIFNAAGAGFPDAATVIEPRTIVVALIVGFGVTLMATIVPAMRASRIPPVAAMRPEITLPSGAATRRWIIGGVLTVLGVVLYLVGILAKPGGTAQVIIMVAVGAVFVFLGVTMLASRFASPVSRALGAPIAKMFGVPGRLAGLNAARTPRRTSSTAAALMIGVALVSGVGVIASSLKDSLADQLGSSIKADFYFSDSSFQGFSRQLVEDLRTLPEVSAVSGMRIGSSFKVAGSERPIAAVDGTDFPEIIDVDVRSGGFDGLADGGVMVHKDSAGTLDLKVGDPVEVTWKNGTTQTLTVRGIFADASVLGVNWMVDTKVFEAANPSSINDQFAGARIVDGTDLEVARASITSVTDKYPQVQVQDQAEFRKSQEDQLNQLLTIVYGLLLFAVVIAVLGIMNTLALSVFERTREFGLLRAVGTTRRQLKRAVRWESVIVSVFGALLGLVVGLSLGIAATKGMRSVGVTTTSLPVATIIAILVASVLAGMLAAIWPARRAAKLDVLEAIATD